MACSGAEGLNVYKAECKTFIDSMKKLEFVADGFGSSKYTPVHLVLESLQKEGTLPNRYIVSD